MSEDRKIRVFAVSGFNAGDKIIASGVRTGVFGHGVNEQVFIDKLGPYDSSYVFPDTQENRSLYEEYQGWYNQQRKEISRRMCATITLMRFGTHLPKEEVTAA